MLENLPVLTIRQPWAALIIHGGKDIENRSWPTRFRGRFYVHASKRMSDIDLRSCKAFCRDHIGRRLEDLLPPSIPLEHGMILGSVEMFDCITADDAYQLGGRQGVWRDRGTLVVTWCFRLRNPVPLKVPVPCKGQLGFFRLPVTARE